LDDGLKCFRPSPDGAAVARVNYKCLLAEREAELKNLRETMERNERAILQVIADQRRQSDEAAAKWRLVCTQTLNEMLVKNKNSLKEQQLLLDALERLQTENTHLKAVLTTTRDHFKRLQQQERNLKELALDEKESLNIPDMTSVKSTRSLVDDNSFSSFLLSIIDERLTNIVNEEELVIPRLQLQQLDDANRLWENTLKTVDSRTARDSVDMCFRCARLNHQLDTERATFNSERSRWLKEKERVVDYHKLLQTGYLQLVQRCQELERQLEHYIEPLTISNAMLSHTSEQFIEDSICLC